MTNEQLAAVKQALEALESGDGWRQSDAITALQSIIEQPAPYVAEPRVQSAEELRSVERGEPDHGDELTIAYMSGLHDGKKLAAQPAVQEPVAWIDMRAWPPIRFREGVLRSDLEHLDGLPLYTTPPAAQPAVPLTDEEIYEMYNEPRSDSEMLAFARAIESAHGITAAPEKGGAA